LLAYTKIELDLMPTSVICLRILIINRILSDGLIYAQKFDSVLNLNCGFRGTAVCSGKAHPDQIVSREECLRADKRRYYSNLEKYHQDIIDYLQTLKEKWESCKDPEKDIVKMMWGSVLYNFLFKRRTVEV
jgi:hypothetical protein